MNKSVTIGVSEFVKRQTKDSQFTHYEGSWNDLANRTKEEFEKGNYTEGYRDGVILVHMDNSYGVNSSEVGLFYTYTDFPMFDGMKLDAQWAKTPGREHEPSKLQVKILEPKIKCNYVDIVLYRKDVLEEDGDPVTGCDWDVVSINGRLKKEPHPMDALTIVRNWLHLKGGTEMKGATTESVLDMLCETILFKNGMKKQWKKIKNQRK